MECTELINKHWVIWVLDVTGAAATVATASQSASWQRPISSDESTPSPEPEIPLTASRAKLVKRQMAMDIDSEPSTDRRGSTPGSSSGMQNV